MTVQIVAIYVYGMRFSSPTLGAQGRFLFAAIGPLAALCAIGLVHWPSPRMRIVVCGAAVSLLVVLDLVSWTTVIIPAYAR